MDKIKTFGYVRVSGKGQIDKTGFDRQEKAIAAFARKNNLEIHGIFREEGVSGTCEEIDRPAFKTMMAAILSNGVKTILIERLDRLAREYRIQEELLIYLARHGVSLVSVDTGEDITKAILDDPMKKAIIQIQGVFAELDKSILVKKLKLSREKVRKEKGKCEGAKRFGEDNEEEREVIKKIIYMRRLSRGQSKRLSYGKIAALLNEERISTKRGKEWTATGVYNVINRGKKN